MHKWVRQTGCPGNADRETVRSVPVAQVAQVLAGGGDRRPGPGRRPAGRVPAPLSCMAVTGGGSGPRARAGTGLQEHFPQLWELLGKTRRHPARPLQGQGWGVL